MCLSRSEIFPSILYKNGRRNEGDNNVGFIKVYTFQMLILRLWRRGRPSLTFLGEYRFVLLSYLNILINNNLSVSRLRLTCHSTSHKLAPFGVRFGVRLWRNSRCEGSRRRKDQRS